MVFRKFVWPVIAALTVIVLTGCNIGATPAPTVDVNAIYTQAAETALANFSQNLTQTALAVPPTALPTSTPLATFTPLPTFSIIANSTPLALNTPGLVTLVPTTSVSLGTQASSNPVGCADAMFVGETVADGTVFAAGKVFTKSWNFSNTGTCTWGENFTFAYKSGDKLSAEPLYVKIIKSADYVKPGSGIAFNIKMTAPSQKGEYKGFWQMKDDKGNWFGSLVYVDIVVK